jgi:hypothetical protein
MIDKSFPMADINEIKAEQKEKPTCQYGYCENEATTEGFVVAKNDTLPPGSVEYVDVFACDKHKKLNGFFEYPKEKTNEKSS